jgi:hypothetical protein
MQGVLTWLNTPVLILLRASSYISTHSINERKRKRNTLEKNRFLAENTCEIYGRGMRLQGSKMIEPDVLYLRLYIQSTRDWRKPPFILEEL